MPAMCRRDEVWEMKRQRFLNRQGSGASGCEPAKPGNRCQPPPISTSAVGGAVEERLPTSPLSQLVREGYPSTAAPQTPPNRQRHGLGSFGGGCPPTLPGSRGSDGRQESRSQAGAPQANPIGGNTAGITAQHHQQQNDPNYAGRYSKPQGYRVTHAPGGGSSLCLGDGSSDMGTSGPGRGRAAMSGTGQRQASPFGAAPASAARRSPSPFSQELGGGRVPGALEGGSGRYAPAGEDARYGAAGGGSSSRPPMPIPRNDSRDLGVAAVGGNSMAPQGFGARVDSRSSNAFACGHSQNTGNYLSDKRTTRVLRPPGGASQICFG